MSIQQAFEAFMQNDFESAVDSSTQSLWGGNGSDFGYSVELFGDGTYRVLPNSDIGNLYESPGVIVNIPGLSDDEWDDDPSIRYYDRAEEAIKDYFDEVAAIA